MGGIFGYRGPIGNRQQSSVASSQADVATQDLATFGRLELFKQEISVTRLSTTAQSSSRRVSVTIRQHVIIQHQAYQDLGNIDIPERPPRHFVSAVRRHHVFDNGHNPSPRTSTRTVRTDSQELRLTRKFAFRIG